MTTISDGAIDDFTKFLSVRMRMAPIEVQQHINLARGVEVFRDYVRMMENGGGDCDNMASLRAAELSVAGINGVPYMTNRPQPNGKGTIYHALVKHIYDGSSEDPSLILGMGGEAKKAERREECRKNVERYDNLWRAAQFRVAQLPRSQQEAAAIGYATAIDKAGYLPGNFTMAPRDRIFRVGSGEPMIKPKVEARSVWTLLKAAA